MTTWINVLTAGHTALSIVALLLGVPAVLRLSFRAGGSSRESAFLAAASATTLTGFMFPFHGITPAIIVGVISAFVLILTFFARKKMARIHRGWSIRYIMGIIVSEYFLLFVAVAQAFGKIPSLHAMAPTLKEPPFGIAQGIVLLMFVALALSAIRRSAAKQRMTTD